MTHRTKIEKFNHTFYDSQDVETLIILEKEMIILKLVDIKGKKCEIHFEGVKNFFFDYGEDEAAADTLNSLAEIEQVNSESYNIEYMFGSKLKIECSMFYYYID